MKQNSVQISPDLSMTLTPSGDLLEIEVMNSAPVDPPMNGKGVVFVVISGIAYIYAWDGSNWIVQ